MGVNNNISDILDENFHNKTHNMSNDFDNFYINILDNNIIDNNINMINMSLGNLKIYSNNILDNKIYLYQLNSNNKYSNVEQKYYKLFNLFMRKISNDNYNDINNLIENDNIKKYVNNIYNN